FEHDAIATHAPAKHERAIVSSLYSDSYLPGILTLAQSLTAANTSARFVLLYFPERIPARSVCLAEAAGWELVPVERIAPPDNGPLFHRYADQYTKLRLWALDALGIKMGVYLDGDTLVRRNIDELFSLPYNFAAVPDIYTDKGFTMDINAGVLVFRTSTATFEDMLRKVGSARFERRFAEQGFLRMYFAHQVLRLPFIYNANLAIKRWNEDTWSVIMEELRVIHYTLVKPFPEERKMHFDNGMWKSEFELWERHYNDSLRALAGKCIMS
ncbi:nucleotide-diphospho-sugar transferase, partial [Schizopora paradoxa]